MRCPSGLFVMHRFPRLRGGGYAGVEERAIVRCCEMGPVHPTGNATALGALTAGLRTHPVIAAVRDEQSLEAALGSLAQVVFLLGSPIARLGPVAEVTRKAGKLLFVHLDFVAGMGRDEAAVEYLAEAVRPTGVITTRSNLVAAARRVSLIPVQRLFLLDSQSVHTGLEAARSSRAEVVEVLPGIIPRAVADTKAQLPHTVIIAGGLVRSAREVGRAMAAGAAAVSSSSKTLWHMRPDEFAAAATAAPGGRGTP